MAVGWSPSRVLHLHHMVLQEEPGIAATAGETLAELQEMRPVAQESAEVPMRHQPKTTGLVSILHEQKAHAVIVKGHSVNILLQRLFTINAVVLVIYLHLPSAPHVLRPKVLAGNPSHPMGLRPGASPRCTPTAGRRRGWAQFTQLGSRAQAAHSREQVSPINPIVAVTSSKIGTHRLKSPLPKSRCRPLPPADCRRPGDLAQGKNGTGVTAPGFRLPVAM